MINIVVQPARATMPIDVDGPDGHASAIPKAALRLGAGPTIVEPILIDPPSSSISIEDKPMNRDPRIMISLFSLAAMTVGLVGSAAAADNPAIHAAPPTPAELWQQIRVLEKSKSIMPFSHAFQPGSRTVDVFTTDLSNQPASAAITKARSVQAVSRYPDGSLLVKNNYNAQHHLTGVTAMLKLSGYDAANRNWVMAAYSPTGKSVAFGKITSCDACHAMVTKSDFVFAPPPSQLLPVSVWKVFFPKQAMSPTYLTLLSKFPGSVVK